ncbi:MAG: hypothetical protein WC510_04680 [Candidatus Omnitrophota bacterium]
MRRIYLSLVLMLCLTSTLYAAPSYGTKMPAKRHFFSGVQSNIIFKRYLENDYGKLRSMQNFLLLSYGVYDWLSLDLKGGAGYIKQHPQARDEIDYPSGFAGGYGFRLRIYEKVKTKMVFGFQHISVHPKSVHLGDIKNKAVLDDWQFSVLLSQELAMLMPYLGTKWSRMDYIHWENGQRRREKSDPSKGVGILAGCDFNINKNLWLNLEGQFLDNEAVSFSINLGF